jgi:hypothetical protein
MIDRLPRQLAAILLVALCASVVAAAALASSRASDTDGVWVNGVLHDLIVTGPASATSSPRPLYVISPVSAVHPLHALADARTHGFGAHDHVISLPRSAATFHGACELTLVVPGRRGVAGRTIEARRTLTPAGMKPLLYAARLGARFTPLTSTARIAAAIRAGLAAPIDTHMTVACTVSPHTNG